MAQLDPLPLHFRELLTAPPDPGSRNLWLFSVARASRRVASPAKVRSFLQSVAARWSDRDFAPEIERAVRRAFELPLPSAALGALASFGSPWPAFNPDAWARRSCAPLAFGARPIEVSSEVVLDALFPGDPFLCLALNPRSALTQRRSRWRGLEAAHQFLVANPMVAEIGLTQEGHASPRCLANACRRKSYQVVEFDRGSLREQAAVLSSLDAPAAPLVLVVWSGGKSLHGWFDVRALSPSALRRFFRFAVFLGADPSLWDSCKLVRMPGGTRSPNVAQPVLRFVPPLHA
jgi:hypothetical protein